MAGYERNVAGQALTVFAFDVVTGIGKTGDSGNLTLYRSVDDGTLTQVTDTTAEEIDSTNAPGYYRFDLSQTEVNGQYIHYFPKSSTTSPNNVGVTVHWPTFTVPANFSTQTWPTAVSIADAVADEPRSGHATAGTFGEVWSALPSATAGTVGGLALYDNIFSGMTLGSVSDVSPAAGDFDGNAGLEATTDNLYRGAFLVFLSGGLEGVARKITAYTASSRNFTFTGTANQDADAPFPVAPTNGDVFGILGFHGQ